MKKISKNIFFLGKTLHLKELDSFHLGVIVGLFHLVVIDIFSMIAFVAPAGSSTWIYLLFIAPLFFVLFWVWVAYVILNEYTTVAFHDAVLIAKWSCWPFVALAMLAGTILLMASDPSFGLPDDWKTISYYLFFSSVMLIVLNFSVLLFTLRHPLKKR